MRRTVAKGQRGKGTKGLKRLLQLTLLCSFVPLSLCAEKNAASQDQVSIRWTSDPANPYKVVVEVYGLSADAIERLRRSKPSLARWQRLLSVYVGQEGPRSASDLPPMAGVYRVESNALRFEPQFPMEPGLAYHAVVRPDQLPGGSGAAAAVTSVYQSPGRSSTPATMVRWWWAHRGRPSTGTTPSDGRARAACRPSDWKGRMHRRGPRAAMAP